MAEDVRKEKRDPQSNAGATSAERRPRLVRARPPLQFTISKLNADGNSTIPSAEELTAQDFRHLIHISSAEIGCFTFASPIRCDLSAEAFAQEMYKASSRCLEGNHRLADSAGLIGPEDLLDLSLSDILPQHLGFDRMFREWHSRSLTGQGFDAHTVDRKGRQTIYHAAIYGRIENERLTRVWVILRDITAFARAIRALGKSEKHYRALLDATDTLFLRALPDGTIEHMSKSAQTLLRSGSVEPLNLASILNTLTLPADNEVTRTLTEHREMAIETPLECSLRLRTGASTYTTYTIRQAAHINATGELDYFDLFAYPAVRSRTLSEDHNTSSTFAAGLIHDVNNQLMVVRSHLEMGLSSTTTSYSPSHEHLRQALEATKLASMMTLHALGRGSPDSPYVEDVSVGRLLQTTATNMRHITPPAIILRVDPCAPHLSVRAHLPHLHQILTNLVLNARDALAKSGTITLAASEQNNTVIITVSDDGCGMTPDLLEKVFTPFFSTKTKDKGSGLGLSMVRELARQNNGEIGIESIVDCGTVVSLILPRGDPQHTSDSSHHPSTLKRGPATIFLADDETAVRDTLLLALSRRGYIVCAAPDGRSILEELKRRSDTCELIIIDDGMPSMSAKDLISSIRSLAPKLPILLTSGNPSRAEILYGESAPCEFLAKPFGLDELYTKIELLTGTDRTLESVRS